MKVTKYDHACLVVDKGDSRLIIDPGSFTPPLPGDVGVVAVVITHEHADHWTPEHLERILRLSPGTRIVGPPGVVAAASGFAIEPVADGDVVEIEPFTLSFFGKKHAVIHSSIPVIDNVGVLVNDALYYGGDSYTVPPVTVKTLAVPIGAPWLRIGDAMDYVIAIAPRHAFPVHEATLSRIGRDLGEARLTYATELGGGSFTVLEPGDSLEL
jgi:L-ascorbate metabolism protein UlaG (beta-lactamase superfamily)